MAVRACLPTDTQSAVTAPAPLPPMAGPLSFPTL